jgi:hypothetical protein
MPCILLRRTRFLVIRPSANDVGYTCRRVRRRDFAFLPECELGHAGEDPQHGLRAACCNIRYVPFSRTGTRMKSRCWRGGARLGKDSNGPVLALGIASVACVPVVGGTKPSSRTTTKNRHFPQGRRKVALSSMRSHRSSRSERRGRPGRRFALRTPGFGPVVPANLDKQHSR